MKLTIGNDLHLGSKHASMTWHQFVLFISYNPDTILDGDIVDMSNCHKKEIGLWKERLEWIAKNYTLVRGNHSLNQVEAPDFIKIGDVYITHGDLGFFWSVEKAMKYRSKQPGAGFLKRTASSYYDVFRHLKPFKADAQFYAACDKVIAEHNPKVIILAHFHPEENIDFMYKGVRILILKRGIQTIDLGAM